MIKRIIKGVISSLKELAIVGKAIKNVVKNCIYIIVGGVYFTDFTLDRIYDFISVFYKSINKRLQKILFYLVLGMAIFGLMNLYSNDKKVIKVIERVEAKEIAKENIDSEEEIVEEVKEEVVLCEMDTVSCKIKNAADSYGLDYKLAIAIARWETGNYTSDAFKNKNNVGGLMYWNGSSSQLQSFSSLEAGIDAFVRLLKYNYIDLGLTTIEAIQKKYAPVGVANDPNNLNSNWVNGVSKIYQEMEK